MRERKQKRAIYFTQSNGRSGTDSKEIRGESPWNPGKSRRKFGVKNWPGKS